MANYLPNAVARYRQMGSDLMGRADELDEQQPDYTAYQRLGRTQKQIGESSMLNALAAQFAGPDFEPVQAQYLKRAMAAQDPVKIGNYGYVDPQTNEAVVDPMYQREKTIDNLRRRAIALEDLATKSEIASEREAARREQNDIMNQIRMMNAMTARMIAEARGAAAQPPAGANVSVSGQPSTPQIITPDVQPDEALGLKGAFQRNINVVTDMLGFGNPQDPNTRATARMESLANQTQLYLQDAVPGRPSNYLLQMLEKQAIRPNRLAMGPSGAAQRANATLSVITTGLNENARILNSPQGYSDKDINQARDAYSRLSQLKAEYDAFLRNLSSQGSAGGAGTLSPQELQRLQQLEEKQRQGTLR